MSNNPTELTHTVDVEAADEIVPAENVSNHENQKNDLGVNGLLNESSESEIFSEENIDTERNSSAGSLSKKGWGKYFPPTWRGFDLFLSITTKIVLVCSAIFAVFQYMAAIEDRKIDQTFKYMAVYQYGPVSAQRSSIRNVITSREQDLQGIKLSNANFDRLILGFVLGDIGEPIRDELDTLADFFSGLNHCIDQGLCHREVAESYFTGEAEFYWRYFKSYYLSRRNSDNPNFAEDLESLAKKTIHLNSTQSQTMSQ